MGFTFERSGGFQGQDAIEDLIRECFLDGNYETVSEALDRPHGNSSYRDYFVVTPQVPRGGEVPFEVTEFDVALRQMTGSGDWAINMTPVSVGRIIYDS